MVPLKRRALKVPARNKKQKELWLASYSKGSTRKAAWEAAGISGATFYRFLRMDPAFAAQVEEAREVSTCLLEDEAERRAMTGSDTMLIFLLKARRPNVYRERYEAKLTGDFTHATLNPTDIKGLSTEELETATALYRKMLGEK